MPPETYPHMLFNRFCEQPFWAYFYEPYSTLLCRRMLGLNPGLLRCAYWQSELPPQGYFSSMHKPPSHPQDYISSTFLHLTTFLHLIHIPTSHPQAYISSTFLDLLHKPTFHPLRICSVNSLLTCTREGNAGCCTVTSFQTSATRGWNQQQYEKVSYMRCIKSLIVSFSHSQRLCVEAYTVST